MWNKEGLRGLKLRNKNLGYVPWTLGVPGVPLFESRCEIGSDDT